MIKKSQLLLDFEEVTKTFSNIKSKDNLRDRVKERLVRSPYNYPSHIVNALLYHRFK